MQIVEKDLVKYLTGKKVFFPVFSSPESDNKVFHEKRGRIDTAVMFVSEEDLFRWCEKEGKKPLGMVKYDLSLEPLEYIPAGKRKTEKVNKNFEKPEKAGTVEKKVKKKTSVKKTSEKTHTRIRRTKEEIAEGLTLEEAKKKRNIE